MVHSFFCFADGPVNKSPKISSYFEKKEKNLDEVLARMASKDNIPFLTFETSADIRDGLKANGFQDLPKSSVTIRERVVNYSKRIREQENLAIKKLKEQGCKFNLTFDELTSNRNRRYMNLILHGKESQFWNLGLIRMKGKMPAENCLELVEKK